MQNNSYSTFVSWAKVVLPLGALVLLSTVFFLARAVDTEMSVPFSTIEDAARESRLSNPNFSGMTDPGASFQVSAKTIKPDASDPTRITIEAPTLRAIDPNEGEIRIRAGKAVLSDDLGKITFEDLVRLETSNGYTIESRGLSADLTAGRAQTDGALEIVTPFGGLSAGQLVVELGKTDGGATLLFQNGVRMTYRIKD